MAVKIHDGTTHWEGCWREHHECAVARIERDEAKMHKLRDDLDAMIRDRNLWRDEHEGDCPLAGEAAALRELLADIRNSLKPPFGRHLRIDSDELHALMNRIDAALSPAKKEEGNG